MVTRTPYIRSFRTPGIGVCVVAKAECIAKGVNDRDTKKGKESFRSPPLFLLAAAKLEDELQAHLYCPAAAAELAGIQELESGNIRVCAAESIIQRLLVRRQSKAVLTVVKRIEEFSAELELSRFIELVTLEYR